MATTENLFDKYGIKEVADVTFYRIEKKEETYEAQRQIPVSSILKGATETMTVYPMKAGKSTEDGFEALVFTDASIITGTNYDCDDSATLGIKAQFDYTTTGGHEYTDDELTALVGKNVNLVNIVTKLFSSITCDGDSSTEDKDANIKNIDGLSFTNTSTGAELSDSAVAHFNHATVTSNNEAKCTAYDAEAIYQQVSSAYNKTDNKITVTIPTLSSSNGTITCGSGESDDNEVVTVTTSDKEYALTFVGEGTAIITIPVTYKYNYTNKSGSSVTGTFTDNITYKVTVTKDAEGNLTSKVQATNRSVKVPTKYTYTVKIYFLTNFENTEDEKTGVYDNTKGDSESHYKADADYDDVGTHEFTYAQQICMLFAKKQNLISKTGVRYSFEDTDTMFGDITFNDQFAAQPNSSEQVVVVGITGYFTEGKYDLSDVNAAIKDLTATYTAKAYDVVYDDYAELVVEDEMGFYNPRFLGYSYTRNNGIGTMTHFDDEYTYKTWSLEDDQYGRDIALDKAEMWGDEHYSINDAIDALRQKKLILDRSEKNNLSGFDNIFGGYKVAYDADPTVTEEDIEEGYEYDKYKYTVDGVAVTEDDEAIESNYSLAGVKEAITSADVDFSGGDLRVDPIEGAKASNRAIYVQVNNVDTAAGAFIYLLHNKNYKTLAADKDGIFTFEDKKGNTLYYQDKIFKGVEYLALVILGKQGLIFVVNRHGNTDVSRMAWMVSETGYINNSKAEILVENGLIHTTDITVNSETFEATCTVKGLTVHRTKKRTNRYTPVLFLDTLKVSTIEQTAEEVYATGGLGNANLIGWDYGKEITLTLQDALFTPASMSAIFGSYEGNDFRKGVKETKSIDRFEKVVAKRSFIVPAGNSEGTPTEANQTAQAVFYDPATMEPYADGTPIAEGEVFYKYTRSIAYEGQSIGNTIEISATKFPGTYKVVGDTYVRSKDTGEDERFQFVVPQAKMTSEQTITLEADGDPTVKFMLSNAVVKIA